VITIDPKLRVAPPYYQKHNNKAIQAAAVSEIGQNEAFEEYHTTKLCTQSITYECCIINKSVC
jgi:hypothetical protein